MPQLAHAPKKAPARSLWIKLHAKRRRSGLHGSKSGEISTKASMLDLGIYYDVFFKVVKIRGSHWAMPLTSGYAPLQVFEIEFGFFIFLSQSFRNTGNGLFHFLNKWMSDMVLFLYFFPGNMMPCRAPVLYIMFQVCPLIPSPP